MMKCECCGRQALCRPYGEADASGHIWTHYTCNDCQAHCSSDEDGSPVHMLDAWDGRAETFSAHVAPIGR